jgi:hypothetical protein
MQGSILWRVAMPGLLWHSLAHMARLYCWMLPPFGLNAAGAAPSETDYWPRAQPGQCAQTTTARHCIARQSSHLVAWQHWMLARGNNSLAIKRASALSLDASGNSRWALWQQSLSLCAFNALKKGLHRPPGEPAVGLRRAAQGQGPGLRPLPPPGMVSLDAMHVARSLDTKVGIRFACLDKPNTAAALTLFCCYVNAEGASYELGTKNSNGQCQLGSVARLACHLPIGTMRLWMSKKAVARHTLTEAGVRPTRPSRWLPW